MSVIFPNAKAAAASPSSYQFASADQAISQMLDGGFEVFSSRSKLRKTPRMNAAKWANVVRKVVEHVNGSFAAGLHAGVRYWEIGNEAHAPLFGSGTKEEFYDLFSRAALAIKAADPTVRVGGPGMAAHTDEAWLRGFLRHARAANAPVDFVS
jgi:xylan 1,4-beta-xylosidase